MYKITFTFLYITGDERTATFIYNDVTTYEQALPVLRGLAEEIRDRLMVDTSGTIGDVLKLDGIEEGSRIIVLNKVIDVNIKGL